MEILELLGALPDLLQLGCCFLELAAGLSDLGAGTAGYKLYKERKIRKQNRGRVDVPPQPATPVWPFLVLLFLGVIFTILVMIKYLR